MKHTIPTWTHLALVLTVPAWLLAVPAAAQGHVGGGGGGGSHASSGGSGGGSASGGGGGHASGGGGGGHVSGGGGGGGARSGGGGGARTSGVAVSRGGGQSGGARSTGGYSGRTPQGAARRGADASGSGIVGAASGDRSATRDAGRTPGVVPEFSRPREGRPTIGTAVPRTGSAPTPGGGAIVVPGYYGGYIPWGFAGLGFGSYFGGYYDPYLGGWGDPYDGFGYGGGYGYGGSGYDDPGTFTPQYPQRYDEGALRLKIKPNGAAVYVDGTYVGVVDEYDGIFQKLHLDAGAHRVEVRMPGFETLSFDIRIEPDHTTTYHGELTKGPQ